MSLIIIAAIGKNNELGKDNKLIWHIPGDLKFFKEKTMNHTILMGSNTFYSLPGVLPKRKHIVLTSKESGYPEEVVLVHNLEDAIKYCQSINDDIYIIGGAKVYEEFLPYVDKMYLTEIAKTEARADAYFPTFNNGDWNKEIIAKNNDDIPYKHVLYKRKKK